MGWFDGSSKWASGKAKQPSAEAVAAGEGWLPPRAVEARRRRESGVGSAEPETLGPGWGRWVWAALLTGVTVVVGLVWVAVLADWLGGSRGLQETATLWLVSLILLGLGIATGYVGLSLTNPKVLLRFDRRVVELGQPVVMRWEIHGRAGRFERFEVRVKAFERVYYTRGTDRITEESTRVDEVVYERDLSGGAGRSIQTLASEGEASLVVPAGAMHSFSADNNLVIWQVEIRGWIRRWPDVKHRHEFTVVPAGWG